MSVTLKRPCPFAFNIQYGDSQAFLAMDPDPFEPRYLPKDLFPDWNPVSPTLPEDDVYPGDPSRRSRSPPKRPRNAKNLSLSVPAVKLANSLPGSAPASPFRSPRLPSRRPSNLTINIHSLHRHPSTPELYTSNIGSPIVSSPAAYTSRQFPILKLDSVRRSETDRPKSRHTDPSLNDVSFEESVEREKAYPDGPRLILEPNIWLYAEPDLRLAKTYDVVVNVAREVNNPFIITERTPESSRLSPESDFEENTPSPYSPYSSTVSASPPSIPSSISSGVSTLSPQLASKSGEPITPAHFKYNNVEYMHIPWDHNSSLSQELPAIVDHILERSDQGKKILVHCQCGVSRSATLVIALVMKKMGLGTHEAYAYVKERSPWIGPNMSLIYQLTDYGRSCGYERKTASQTSAPSTAPLGNAESRRYKEPIHVLPIHAHLSRPSAGRTQSQDRPGFLDVDVDRVVETLSSPRFVVSESVKEKHEDGTG